MVRVGSRRGIIFTIGTVVLAMTIIGLVNLVTQVSAYDQEQPTLARTARPDGRGRYRISDLPDGRYWVSLVGRGKVSVISEPTHHDVKCRGSQTHTRNFKVIGVTEG